MVPWVKALLHHIKAGCHISTQRVQTESENPGNEEGMKCIYKCVVP